MLKRCLQRFGLCPMIALVTLISIVASVLITAGVHAFVLGAPLPGSALFLSILCPALIAPVMGGFTLRLVHELDAAHEQLRLITNLDPLTGVCNRRRFMERLREEMELSRRDGARYSVAFIDVDNFKAINDRHGHLSGDEVLRRLAACCAGAMRQTDLFARIGGEEFAVLLPRTRQEDALSLLERLRARVAGLQVELPEAVLNVTVSIGLASPGAWTPEINGVLREADEALYAAKREGKNRVVVRPALRPVAAESPAV